MNQKKISQEEKNELIDIIAKGIIRAVVIIFTFVVVVTAIVNIILIPFK